MVRPRKLAPLGSVLAVFALVLVSVHSIVADAAEWVPGAQRQITPDATSRGLTFRVTVTFKTPDPSTTSVFINDGLDGDAWFIPQDYVRFKVVGYTASLAPNHYNLRSSWIWDPGSYTAGQVITLKYDVKVAATVASATYSIAGSVGTGDGRSAPIAGAAAIAIRPVSITPATGRATYQRTETVEISAAVTYPDGTPVPGATVLAAIDKTGQTLVLTPGSAPGNYLATFVLKVDTVVGTWRATISADDGNNNGNTATVDFTVTVAKLRIDVATDAPTYVGGQTVRIDVTVAFPVGTPVDNAVAIAALSPSGASVPLGKASVPGKYSGSYALKADASVGTWSAAADASDPYGNAGSGKGSFEVGFIVLLVTSSSAKTTYSRFESVQLTAVVEKPDHTVMAGASVQASFDRTIDQIVLTEVSPGKYAGGYRPPKGVPTGKWGATVTAKFGPASGTSTVEFSVVPAALTVTLTTGKPVYFQTETVVLTARVNYPDGSAVTGATVSVRLDKSAAPISLLEKGAGVYEGSYVLRRDAPIGTWTAAVTAVDSFQNSGSSSTTFQLALGLLSLQVVTDLSYQISQSVHVRATATYPDGSPFSGGTAGATFSPGGAQITLLEVGATGVYGGDYRLAPGATLGSWTVSVEIKDTTGNKAQGTAAFRVERAVFSVEVQLSSSSLKRLEWLQISARAAYPDKTPVIGAEVIVRLEPGAVSVTLAEAAGTSGLYSGSVRFPTNAQLGPWTATAKVSHRDGLGETTNAFGLSPATLGVAVTSPRLTYAQRGSAVIEATVVYPDGSAVPQASAKVTLNDGTGNVVTDATMTRNATGVLRFEFSLPADARVGRWSVRVQASDADGNTGTGTTEFAVDPYREPPLLELSALLVLIVAIVIGVAAAFGVAWARRSRRAKK